MQQLFKKVGCFSDIHYGLRHNSKQHNDDCHDFVKWFISEAQNRGVETCIFLGDFHHHRSNINIMTLNYTMECLRLLNDSFENTYILVGNHDLYFREKRDVHALVIGSEFKNIHLINEITHKGEVTLMPWLVGDEYKTLPNIKSRYIFGHFEIPGFKMNAQVEMPDHGAIKKDSFVNQEYVFSGHFHKRQQSRNIHYIGNPFGHNYADIWDTERGCMFMDWGGEPDYIDYTLGPRYVSVTLSDLCENTELYLKPKTYLSVVVDIDITYEEANYMRESFIESYDIRELKLIYTKDEEHSIEYEGDITFQTIDQIVSEQIGNIDSNNFDKKTLLSIYNNL